MMDGGFSWELSPKSTQKRSKACHQVLAAHAQAKMMQQATRLAPVSAANAIPLLAGARSLCIGEGTPSMMGSFTVKKLSIATGRAPQNHPEVVCSRLAGPPNTYGSPNGATGLFRGPHLGTHIGGIGVQRLLVVLPGSSQGSIDSPARPRVPPGAPPRGVGGTRGPPASRRRRSFSLSRAQCQLRMAGFRGPPV